VTKREEIFELLKNNAMSAQQIAFYFKCPIEDIEQDLHHLAKSVRPAYELRMFPAHCESCEFVFKERSKIRKPSKCPKCRNERIIPPLFKIEPLGKKKKL